MATRVNTTTGTADAAASSIAATAADHTAGNLLVVCVGWEEGGNLTSVTDTAGNSYTLLTQEGSTEPLTCIAYCANAKGHATNVVTATFSSAVPEFRRIIVVQYSGCSIASVVDTEAGDNSLTPSTNFLAGDLVTSTADCVLVTCGKGFASSTFTSFANWGEVVEVGGTFAVSERFVSAPGTYSAGQTFGASTSWASVAAAFKAVPPSVTLTGTALASITEADIVAGGKTIIATFAGDTVAPASGAEEIEFIANALGGTADTTSFSITLPTTQAGDLLILEFTHRGVGDGTIGGTSVSIGGLTWTLKHSQLYATSTFSGKTYWTRATGDHSGQTVTGSSLTNSCAAIVTQYRGALSSGDPLADATIVGEENASGNETQAQITTATNGAMVVLVVVNSPDVTVASQACTSPGTLAERAERLSTGGTDTAVSHASELKAAAGATGAFTWAQTNGASGSWAYAITPEPTTPFNDARAAFIAAFDSAQAEGTGWDAEVKAKAAVTEVARTSDTVVTWTIAAQAGYNITAQETITGTIAASMFAAVRASVVATPTFTIDPGGGGGGGSVVPVLVAHYRQRRN